MTYKARRTLAMIASLVLVSPMTILWKLMIVAPAVTLLLLEWDEWSYKTKKD